MEFEKEIEKAKNKINECKLSDKFKSNLKEKLDLEYEKKTKKIKTPFNANKTYIFTKKFAAAIACCIIVFSSYAFADEIENLFVNLFYNTDRIMEQAIENGNIQTIDMDYVTNDDVSIKVNYLIMEENSMYVVFDVVAKDECEEIYLYDLKIYDYDDNVIYNNKLGVNNISYNTFDKKISKNNYMIFCKLTNDKNKLSYDGIKIYLENISIRYDNEYSYINCEFLYNIDIERNLFK